MDTVEFAGMPVPVDELDEETDNDAITGGEMTPPPPDATPTEPLPPPPDEVTVTVVWAVVDPFAFVAVRVYAVVEFGKTTVDPLEVATDPMPWLMDTDNARFVDQERVADDPELMEEGEAVKKDIAGKEAGSTS